jgi:hypothetical protein
LHDRLRRDHGHDAVDDDRRRLLERDGEKQWEHYFTG